MEGMLAMQKLKEEISNEIIKNSENKEGWIHSACSMCTAAPMKVRVRNGRIAEVRGEDIPGFDGKLCGKAIAGIGGRIYAPDRILYPLKRVRERGEGRFVRCTWEEVIDARFQGSVEGNKIILRIPCDLVGPDFKWAVANTNPMNQCDVLGLDENRVASLPLP